MARRVQTFLLVVMFLTAPQTLAAEALDDAPKLLSRSVVFNYPHTDPYDPMNRFGYNHAPSVTVLANGDLLCAWFSGPFEAAVSQVILAARSRDGGHTWEKASVLQDIPRQSDFDPAFITDGDRTWFFFTAGRWNSYPPVNKAPGGGVGPASYHTHYRQSIDHGVTWSEPVQATGHFFCRSNGIRLSSGELLLPVYTLKNERDESKACVFRSTDGGKAWALGEGIASPAGSGEPTVAEVSGGNVMMLLRTGDGFLWRTYSRDKGQTWSQPEKTDMYAAESSHSLFRLRDGRLLLTHGPCKPPRRTPLTMRLSTDDGNTWGKPLQLAQIDHPEEGAEEWGRQVTYPSVAQLEHGTVVVVWTRIVMSDSEQYGDIWSARVQLPKR